MKKKLMKPMGKSIYKETAIVSGMEVMAKILGFGRILIISYFFGVSEMLDVYNLALAFPTMIFFVFESAITNTLISLDKTVLDENSKKYLNNGIIHIVLILCLFFLISTIVFRNQCAHLIAPGYSDEKIAVVARMISLFSITIIFRVFSGFFSAKLRIHRKFLSVSIQNVVYNLVFIVGCIFFKEINIDMLVIITIIANLFRSVVLIPSAIHNDIRIWRSNFIPRKNDYIFVVKYICPIVGSLAANELKTVIDKAIASYLLPGAISSLDYAYIIIGIPVSILGNALAIVTFSYFDSSNEGFEIFRKTINKLLIVMIPCSLFVLVFSTGIIKIVYFRGAFDESDLAMTSICLRGYAFTILFNSMILVINNYLYSNNLSKLVFFLTVTLMLNNTIMSAIFGQIMGAIGIAIATTVSSFIYVLIALIAIGKKRRSILNV